MWLIAVLVILVIIIMSRWREKMASAAPMRTVTLAHVDLPPFDSARPTMWVPRGMTPAYDRRIVTYAFN